MLILVLARLSCAIAADFSSPFVSVLDGDMLEVLHNHHPERTRFPQSRRYPKDSVTRSIARMEWGGAHSVCAIICHMATTKS